jgi:hypothetical protein
VAEGYALTPSRVFDFLSAQIKEPGGSAGFLLLSNDRVTQRQRQAAAEFLRSPLHPARNGVSRSGEAVTYFAVHRETQEMAAYVKGEGSGKTSFIIVLARRGTARMWKMSEL